MENAENFENLISGPGFIRPKDFSHLWIVCEFCDAMNYHKIAKENLYICESCDSYMKMKSSERIDFLLDSDTWQPMDQQMRSLDPILFDSLDPLEFDSLDPLEDSIEDPKDPKDEPFNPDEDSDEDSEDDFEDPDEDPAEDDFYYPDLDEDQEDSNPDPSNQAYHRLIKDTNRLVNFRKKIIKQYNKNDTKNIIKYFKKYVKANYKSNSEDPLDSLSYANYILESNADYNKDLINYGQYMKAKSEDPSNPPKYYTSYLDSGYEQDQKETYASYSGDWINFIKYLDARASDLQNSENLDPLLPRYDGYEKQNSDPLSARYDKYQKDMNNFFKYLKAKSKSKSEKLEDPLYSMSYVDYVNESLSDYNKDMNNFLKYLIDKSEDPSYFYYVKKSYANYTNAWVNELKYLKAKASDLQISDPFCDIYTKYRRDKKNFIKYLNAKEAKEAKEAKSQFSHLQNSDPSDPKNSNPEFSYPLDAIYDVYQEYQKDFKAFKKYVKKCHKIYCTSNLDSEDEDPLYSQSYVDYVTKLDKDYNEDMNNFFKYLKAKSKDPSYFYYVKESYANYTDDWINFLKYLEAKALEAKASGPQKAKASGPQKAKASGPQNSDPLSALYDEYKKDEKYFIKYFKAKSKSKAEDPSDSNPSDSDPSDLSDKKAELEAAADSYYRDRGICIYVDKEELPFQTFHKVSDSESEGEGGPVVIDPEDDEIEVGVLVEGEIKKEDQEEDTRTLGWLLSVFPEKEEENVESDDEEENVESDDEEENVESDDEEENVESDDKEENVKIDDEETYTDKMKRNERETGLSEAVETGTGKINGIKIALGVMDFRFIGGSMGSVVGEKITRLIEHATKEFLPLIIVCASGGARMQEGSLSLMQMAKISSALSKYRDQKNKSNQKLFYISILTTPTTGGVTASFAMLADIIIAEPDAYIAFAGKRVIEELFHIEVPEGSQEAEVLFENGFVDLIVSRKLLKSVLTELLQFHSFDFDPALLSPKLIRRLFQTKFPQKKIE